MSAMGIASRKARLKLLRSYPSGCTSNIATQIYAAAYTGDVTQVDTHASTAPPLPPASANLHNQTHPPAAIRDSPSFNCPHALVTKLPHQLNSTRTLNTRDNHAFHTITPLPTQLSCSLFPSAHLFRTYATQNLSLGALLEKDFNARSTRNPRKPDNKPGRTGNHTGAENQLPRPPLHTQMQFAMSVDALHAKVTQNYERLHSMHVSVLVAMHRLLELSVPADSSSPREPVPPKLLTELHRLCTVHVPTFDADELPSMLNAWAVLVERGGPEVGREVCALCTPEWLNQVYSRCKALVQKCSARGAKDMALAAMVFGCRDGDLIAGLCTQVHASLYQYSATDLVRLTQACAVLGVKDRALHSTLGSTLANLIVKLTAQELCSALTAFADMGHHHVKLFDTAAKVVVQAARAFTPEELASIAQAYTKVGHADEDLFTVLHDAGTVPAPSTAVPQTRTATKHVRESSKPTAQASSSSQSTLRKLLSSANSFSQLQALIAQHANQLPADHAAAVAAVHKLAKLVEAGILPSDHQSDSASSPSQLAQQLHVLCTSHLHKLIPDDLITMLQAWAMLLKHGNHEMSDTLRVLCSPEWRAQVYGRMHERLKQCSARQLRNFSEVLGEVGCEDEQLLCALWQQLIGKLPACDLHDLVGVATAHAVLGCKDSALQGALADKLTGSVDKLSPQLLLEVLTAFVDSGTAHRGLFAAAAREAVKRAGEFKLKQLESMEALCRQAGYVDETLSSTVRQAAANAGTVTAELKQHDEADLHKFLRACGSVDKLHARMQAKADRLSRHPGAALTAVSTLIQFSAPSNARLPRQPVPPQLLTQMHELCTAHVLVAGAGDVSRTLYLWALLLDQGAPSVRSHVQTLCTSAWLNQVSDRCYGLLAELNAGQLVLLAVAAPLLGCQHDALLSALRQKLPLLLPQLTKPAELVATARAQALLGVSNITFLEELASRLTLELPHLTPSQLSVVLGAFADGGHHDQALFAAAAKHMVGGMDAFTGEQLTKIVQAYEHVGHVDEQLTRAVGAALEAKAGVQPS